MIAPLKSYARLGVPRRGDEVAQAVGAVLMSLSTIIVAINAQFLRRVDLRPEAA